MAIKKMMQIAGRNKTCSNFRLILIIFVFAICWQLFWNYGFDFFWEDFDIFHVYWNDATKIKLLHNQYAPSIMKPSKFSVIVGISLGYFKNFFSLHRLFQIEFQSYSMSSRPYETLTWDMMSILFGDKVVLYRIFKALIFSLNTCLVFILIRRLSFLLALFGIGLYMTSAEIWLSSTYISVLGTVAQCGVIISVLLFIKLLEKQNLCFKDYLFHYFLIFLVSMSAILTVIDGRYLAMIFFLTLIFFKRADFKVHLLFLAVLFIFQFPLLGFIKKMFFDHSFSPINVGSHGTFASTSIKSLFFSIIKNYIFPKNAIGIYLLIALAITIFLHFFQELIIVLSEFLKRTKSSQNLRFSKTSYQINFFLFVLWFFSTFTMAAMGRSFRYGPGDSSFQLFDLSYFIAPFIISFFYYIKLVSLKINKKVFRAIFILFCSIFIIIQLTDNIFRLNRFRGGVG